MDQQGISERRKHPRSATVRLCKVRNTSSARYIPGRTSDYSAGGTLVHIGSEYALETGQQVEFGVAWGGEAVLREGATFRGVVRRVTEAGPDTLAVGIEFDHVQPMSVAKAA